MGESCIYDRNVGTGKGQGVGSWAPRPVVYPSIHPSIHACACKQTNIHVCAPPPPLTRVVVLEEDVEEAEALADGGHPVVAEEGAHVPDGGGGV